MTERLHFHALEKEMAAHSSVIAWRIPGTEDSRRLPSLGLHRVRHDWSYLAAAIREKEGKEWEEYAKECSKERMKGNTKNNCKQLPIELQFRDQKRVRGREWGRPEKEKTPLTSVLFSPPFIGCPYHSTYPYLTNPGKPNSCLSTFQRPWSYYLHWDSSKSQSILIDYSVYVVHPSPKMSYYMNSEFTKDISIIYT